MGTGSHLLRRLLYIAHEPQLFIKLGTISHLVASSCRRLPQCAALITRSTDSQRSHSLINTLDGTESSLAEVMKVERLPQLPPCTTSTGKDDCGERKNYFARGRSVWSPPETKDWYSALAIFEYFWIQDNDDTYSFLAMFVKLGYLSKIIPNFPNRKKKYFFFQHSCSSLRHKSQQPWLK